MRLAAYEYQTKKSLTGILKNLGGLTSLFFLAQGKSPYFNFFNNQKTRAKTMSSQPDQTTDPSSDHTNNESQATNPRQS